MRIHGRTGWLFLEGARSPVALGDWALELSYPGYCEGVLKASSGLGLSCDHAFSLYPAPGEPRVDDHHFWGVVGWGDRVRECFRHPTVTDPGMSLRLQQGRLRVRNLETGEML